MVEELTTPETPIPRDRWGRPLVTPKGGGAPVAYTRCTTFIDVIEDKFNLQKWMQRQVAIGLSQRPDLQLAVAAHRDEKTTLDKLCEEARAAAASSAAATTGTALHTLTERVDRGLPLPALPPTAVPDLEAYQEATQELTHLHIERFVVQDLLQVGGTPDRVVSYQGQTYIADLKTGSIEYGSLKIAMQLAIYSRSLLYTHPSGERAPHEASTSRGIIIHLPAGQATCSLHWVDLEAGWEAAKLARDIRAWRRRKFRDLTEPFGPPTQFSLGRQKAQEAKEAKAQELTHQKLQRRILACVTADQVRGVWSQHQEEWTPALTQEAQAHIAHLSQLAG